MTDSRNDSVQVHRQMANEQAGEACQPALLLLGPTGAGKSPLGDLLEAQGYRGRRCVHFDFGANLRSVDARGTLPSTDTPPAGLSEADQVVIRNSLQTGALLENEHFPIAGKLLLGFIEARQMTGDDLLLLNGLPRHADQARDMDTYVDVECVFVLDGSAETIYQRIQLDSGGDRGGRIDDAVHLVEKKLATFRERTAPLIEHYDRLGAIIHRFDVGVHTGAADLLGLV